MGKRRKRSIHEPSPAKTTASTILFFRPALVQLPLRSRSVVQQDAHPGSERVGDEIRGTGVTGGKERLKHFDGEADCEPENDGDDSCPFVFSDEREVGAKTHAERDESSNVLEVVYPIAPGHAELVPVRSEEY